MTSFFDESLEHRDLVRKNRSHLWLIPKASTIFLQLLPCHMMSSQRFTAGSVEFGNSFSEQRLDRKSPNSGIILLFKKGSDFAIFHDFTLFFNKGSANILRYIFLKWQFENRWNELKIGQEGPYVGFYRFRWFSEALIKVHCFCRLCLSATVYHYHDLHYLPLPPAPTLHTVLLIVLIRCLLDVAQALQSRPKAPVVSSRPR